jgi:hypothetical protein
MLYIVEDSKESATLFVGMGLDSALIESWISSCSRSLAKLNGALFESTRIVSDDSHRDYSCRKHGRLVIESDAFLLKLDPAHDS